MDVEEIGSEYRGDGGRRGGGGGEAVQAPGSGAAGGADGEGVEGGDDGEALREVRIRCSDEERRGLLPREDRLPAGPREPSVHVLGVCSTKSLVFL